MINKEEHSSQIETLLKLAEEYGFTILTLWKFKALDKISGVVSSVLTAVGLIVVILTAFFIATIGVSLWVGALLGKLWYGFFVVAGAYVFIAILMKLFFNKWIKTAIANMIIKHSLK